ncbi:MAG TPA: hypothetical protein VHJ18_10480 [Streptosporangiaceae bacterium]|jgi:hypothetical protein|nr:hypothetical protein [Streptosporangiaceae bacterium]
MRHRHDRFFVPPVPDPAIARGEGTGSGADAGGERGLDQGGAEPAVAMASPAGAMLAGALVVAGAEAGPAGGVLGRGEDVHVRAELGDEDLGGPLVDARTISTSWATRTQLEPNPSTLGS